MFPLPNMLHFFAHEFTCLRGRGEPFTLVLARPFNSFFFWHNAKRFAVELALGCKKRYEDVLNSNRGEHCRHLVTKTQI